MFRCLVEFVRGPLEVARFPDEFAGNILIVATLYVTDLIDLVAHFDMT